MPFGAAFVALTIYYKVDVLLLAEWRSPVDVGPLYRGIQVLGRGAGPFPGGHRRSVSTPFPDRPPEWDRRKVGGDESH